MPQASASPSPSARAPVVGLHQYCAFLLALFFFLRLLVDTQNSNLPPQTTTNRPFSSLFPDTTSQPQPWVSLISSPMLALPVRPSKSPLNQNVADRVSIVLNSWVSTRSYIVGYAKSLLHCDSDDDMILTLLSHTPFSFYFLLLLALLSHNHLMDDLHAA